MKKIVLATIIAISILSCKKEKSCERDESIMFAYPYGKPDSIMVTAPGSTMRKITYDYYCLDGKRTIITWTSQDICDQYHMSVELKDCTTKEEIWANDTVKTDNPKVFTFPPAPYGPSDLKYQFLENGKGYATYTYKCLMGNYSVYTYTTYNNGESWTVDSVKSTCSK